MVSASTHPTLSLSQSTSTHVQPDRVETGSRRNKKRLAVGAAEDAVGRSLGHGNLADERAFRIPNPDMTLSGTIDIPAAVDRHPVAAAV